MAIAGMNRDNSAARLDAPSRDPLQGTKYDFHRDSVGYGRKSLNPQWPNGAKIAVSFVINYEEVTNFSPNHDWFAEMS